MSSTRCILNTYVQRSQTLRKGSVFVFQRRHSFFCDGVHAHKHVGRQTIEPLAPPKTHRSHWAPWPWGFWPPLTSSTTYPRWGPGPSLSLAVFTSRSDVWGWYQRPGLLRSQVQPGDAQLPAPEDGDLSEVICKSCCYDLSTVCRPSLSSFARRYMMRSILSFGYFRIPYTIVSKIGSA